MAIPPDESESMSEILDPHRQEEREARAQFGEAYVEYARRVPAFVPCMVGGPGEVAP